MVRNPDTAQEAAAKGTVALDTWRKRMNDPRFAAAVARKTAQTQGTPNQPFTLAQLQWAARFKRPPPPPPNGNPTPIHRDWSAMLGQAAAGAEGMFPAKFTWDINATPNCANDFIVFPTGQGASAMSGTATVYTLTLTSNPAAGSTVTLTRTNAPTLTLTASSTLNSTYSFKIGATAAATAQNISDAVNRTGSQVAVSAGVAALVVTITSKVTDASSFAAATTIAGATATKSTTGTNGNGQATIVALNQLYSSCADGSAGHPASQATPAVYWAYNTTAGRPAKLSPALSWNGDQVAFVQLNGAQAQLVLLKWKANDGTVGNPTAPATNLTGAQYHTCATPPCIFIANLNGTPNVSYSAPYIDYYNDVLYIGDDAGKLHKFSGVFAGTPAEVTTGGFPATVATGSKLSSPVYDSVSNKIFVASDMSSTTTGGKLYSVVASTGYVTATQQLGATSINGFPGDTPSGIRSAPMVDSQGGTVYVFVENTSFSWANCNSIECKTVMQFPTGFTPVTTPVVVRLGRGQITTRQLNIGTFDDAWFKSPDSTGNIYVCGSNGLFAFSTLPTLWKIPITAGVMSTAAVQGPTMVTSKSGDCSPVSEVANGGSEFLFVSVPQDQAAAGGTLQTDNGCSGTSGSCTVYMFDLNNLQHSDASTGWGTTVTPNASLPVNGGTTGILVDNISSTTGASQIYFQTLTTTANPLGAAQQASQAALQ